MKIGTNGTFFKYNKFWLGVIILLLLLVIYMVLKYTVLKKRNKEKYTDNHIVKVIYVKSLDNNGNAFNDTSGGAQPMISSSIILKSTDTVKIGDVFVISLKKPDKDTPSIILNNFYGIFEGISAKIDIEKPKRSVGQVPFATLSYILSDKYGGEVIVSENFYGELATDLGKGKKISSIPGYEWIKNVDKNTMFYMYKL